MNVGKVFSKSHFWNQHKHIKHSVGFANWRRCKFVKNFKLVHNLLSVLRMHLCLNCCIFIMYKTYTCTNLYKTPGQNMYLWVCFSLYVIDVKEMLGLNVQNFKALNNFGTVGAVCSKCFIISLCLTLRLAWWKIQHRPVCKDPLTQESCKHKGKTKREQYTIDS